MSIFTSFLKKRIGYDGLKKLAPVPNDNVYLNYPEINGDPSTPKDTDHKSLGQVTVASSEDFHASIDAMSSDELHRKSQEAFDSLKKILDSK